MRTNKKSLATIIITMLMIVCSQLTLQLHSNIAANGSTKIYLIEIVIFVWSIWVVAGVNYCNVGLKIYHH